MRILTPIMLLSLTFAACDDNLTYVQRDDHVGPTAVPLDCRPNLDGQIDASEVSLSLGAMASYRVSPPGESRAVDLLGEEVNGTRTWDWSLDYASDQHAALGVIDISTRWYAEHFEAQAFSVAVDAASALEAVYVAEESRLVLLGFASQDEAPPVGQTLLIFDEPVDYYRFPLQPPMSWQSVGEVLDGVYLGAPFAAQYTYDFSVEAVGELLLPDVTFTQAHLVHQVMTITPLVGPVTVTRQASFLFECFGEVARATSHPEETDEHFTEAAEVRRMGL